MLRSLRWFKQDLRLDDHPALQAAEAADELLAVCLQHEIDHLDGVLFIDRISRLKRAMYDKRVKRWAPTPLADKTNS